MDPKELALKCVEIAEKCLGATDFSIAYNLLNQSERIFPTTRAQKWLRFLHPHIICKPDSQPLEESQTNKEATCSETRPSVNCVEDGEPPAKKSRIAQTTISGLKHKNLHGNLTPNEDILTEMEEIIQTKECDNQQEAPNTFPVLEHENLHGDLHGNPNEEILTETEEIIQPEECVNQQDAPDSIPGLVQCGKRVIPTPLLQYENQDAGEITIVSVGSSAWKGYNEERGGNKNTGNNRGEYQRGHEEHSSYNIIRALLDQAEEKFPSQNVEDVLKYITTQVRASEDQGPSHLTSSRSNGSKWESTKANYNVILDPQPEPPPRDEPIVEPIDFIVQPSVVSPPNRPGRRTNQLQYLHNCINAVWNDTSAEPFRQPADAKNMPEHYKIIRHPMDLGTIRKRLENKYYWCANECLQDIQVMFNNCFSYYQYGDAVFSAGSSLKRLFIDGLRKMPIWEVNLDNSSLGDGDLSNQYAEGPTSAKGEVIADNGTSFPRLIDLNLKDSDFKQVEEIWFDDDDERYHGFQHRGLVKLFLDKQGSYLTIKTAEETLALPQFKGSLPPRPKTAVLGSIVLPARFYRSERISIPRPKPPPREGIIVEPIDVIAQPPVVPPPNRPGRVTNQLQYIQDHVIDEVWNHPFGWRFRQPVDDKNLLDYFKVIRHPMDLCIIKKRLENKYYWSAKECIQDFNVMFTNFHVYYKPWDPSVGLAQLVEKSFFIIKAQMPKEEVEVLVQQQPPPSI